jgi:tetratricopeptide (TPR) repeat protein
VAAARDAFSRIPQTAADQRSAALAYVDVLEGRFQEALARLGSIEGDGWLAFGPALSGPRALLEAFVQDFMGEGEDAGANYRSAAAELNTALGEEVRDPGSGRLTLTSALALTYAGLGQRERAIETALNAVAALPISEDATWGVDRLMALAYVYAGVGEQELATSTLERVLSVPTRYTPSGLGLDPFLGSLHGYPGFERLVRESASRLRPPLVS